MTVRAMHEDRPAISHLPPQAPPEGEEALAQVQLDMLHDRLARAERRTSIPGRATIAMGGVALAAAPLAALQTDARAWLGVWLAAALLAGAIGAVGFVRKARRLAAAAPGAGRRIGLGFVPPLAAGALLTISLGMAGQAALLPGTWLLLYGVAVVAGGALSTALVPGIGLAFIALGGAALVAPAPWHDPLLALGFGGLNVVFGTVVALRYGG